MFFWLWYNIVILIFGVVNLVKKLSQRHRNWLRAKSKKEIRRRNRYNHKKHIATNYPAYPTNNQHDGGIGNVVTAPSNLSFFSNPSETLSFFRKVNERIFDTKYRGYIYFDLSKIETVSVDAIMYLIAMIKNTKRLKAYQIDCLGNVPANENARRIIERCGFYHHVSSKYKFNVSDEYDHINITRGKEANPIFAGNVCKFVHEHSNIDRVKTKSLYTMIIELMANTKQHAYNNNNAMEENWYVFVEDRESYMKFVFLDTGAGIPNTIRTKGLLEKFKNLFSYDDAYFIASALKGEILRSETNLEYRGQGLPEIYKRASSSYIDKFSVVSGRGKCYIDNNGDIVEENLTDELTGTLLSWIINK